VVNKDEDDDTQVYKKPWVGLTDAEIDKIVDAHTYDDFGYEIWTDGKALAQAIEAKLKEKNA